MAKALPDEPTFVEALSTAIADFAEHGYDDHERLVRWVEVLRRAALRSMVPEYKLREELARVLGSVYQRVVERGDILRQHPGVARFTLDRVKPRLRAELDRRILASANLIKLNREASIQKTLQRFSGWSTSIPPDGSDAVRKPEVKKELRKALSQLPFEERRVLIDQGHKFTSELNNIIAVDGGAIAAVWHSNWRQLGYNYREDHKERDLKVYAIRGNWAIEKGLMNKGAGYTDDMTKPGEEVLCRCHYQYIYAISALPPDMITPKGHNELARVRALRRTAA